MRKRYPSDVSREQFGGIHPLLESGRKRTAAPQGETGSNRGSRQARRTTRLHRTTQAMDCGTRVRLAGQVRCLWKNRERKLHSSLQFFLFAFLALLLKNFKQALTASLTTGSADVAVFPGH
jgi:hypothetical protein